jgi:ArsR family transcriptional regulator
MATSSVSITLRVLSDEHRLRLLHLLTRAELSVGEASHILRRSQPLVSAQLAQLRSGGLVHTRRAGRKTLARAAEAPSELVRLAIDSYGREAVARRDAQAAKECVAAREARPLRTGLGLRAIPGRSWEAFAHALLALLPPLRIADVGPGSGGMALLLARRGHQVTAIDRDGAALTRLANLARREGLTERLICRQGDAESLPLSVGAVDCILMSQLLHELESPLEALRSARGALASGGRVLVLDLEAHHETWVRESLGHRHLGFTKAALRELMRKAGFKAVEVASSGRDVHAPHFEGLLGTGVRP